MRRLSAAAVIALVLGAVACAPGPEPIVAGDPCTRCHMPVADERRGAELITRTGVVRKYDAVECLARDLNEGVVAGEDVGSIWVVPYDAPGTLVAAGEAVFLRDAGMREPMGLDLTPFSAGTDPGALVAEHGGTVIDWEGVMRFVAETPPAHGHGH